MKLGSAWNHQISGLESAFGLIGGNDPGFAWGNVKVAQLDTGYTEHSAFGSAAEWAAGQVPLRADEGVNFLELGQPPKDPLTGQGPVAGRSRGHGTRMASTLCAPRRKHSFDKQTFTFSGAAPGLPVVPYRVVSDVVLEPQQFNRQIWLNLANAVLDAISDAKRCRIVSISLGGPIFPGSELGAAIDKAYEKGVIVIAAGGQFTDVATYPGCFDRVIGAGGLKRSEASLRVYNHYRFHAERIDVWAPADPIFRADMARTNTGKFKELWDYGDGTSYAAVHVAAAAAMWLAKHRDRLAAYPGWRTVEAFRDALARSYGALPDAGAHGYTTGTLLANELVSKELRPPEALTYNPRLAEKEQL